MEGVLETAAAGIGAAFGTGAVSPTLAAALRSLLPDALFLRASLRCGAGLFVSDDLLQPGQNELSVVSLKNSLAGLAMAQQQPVVVATPPATAAPAAAQVVCMPVALAPADADAAAAQAAVFSAALAAGDGGSPAASGGQQEAASRPVYVGALMLGFPHTGSLPAPLAQALQALATAAAPYLLLLGLTKAADMADLLRLRAADCICCGGEEDELQDLPLEACRPQLSPRSSGGSAGSAASPFADGVASPERSLTAELDETALNAAAAKALAGASILEAPSWAGKAAAGASGGSSHGQGAGAAALHRRGPKQQQGKQAAGDNEVEAEPKAALRLQAAAAVDAAAPQHMPTGPLLSFADAELEARFAAAHDHVQLRGDALFCFLHLASALTLVALGLGALTGAAVLLALALALPLVAMTAGVDRYVRHREALLSLALLLHACLLRSAVSAGVVRLLPAGTLWCLPWLLRATGAEALAVFTIGFKLRVRRFLPLHILCLALVLGGLPGRCRASAADGCLPAGLHRAAVAVLLFLGGLLPAAAIYKAEARARHRFLAASAPLLGARAHQLGAAATE